MKRKFVLYIIACLLPFAMQAQSASDTLPYKKYPTIPAFNILLTDSTTVFNTFDIKKGKPTVLFYFSPECDHCQKVTENMVKHMDELKHVQIYMCTMMPLSSTREFAQKLGLNRYKNITIGKDQDWFFSAYYGTKYVPFIVVYNSDKKLVRAFEGGVKMDVLINTINEGEK